MLGRVTRLDRQASYGYLEAPDRRAICFTVIACWTDTSIKLERVTEVHFADAKGERGPQASKVIAMKNAQR